MKKYIVELTQEERSRLLELTRKGECRARRLKRALVLLAADEGKIDKRISEEVRVHGVTVERIRKRFVLRRVRRYLPQCGRARQCAVAGAPASRRLVCDPARRDRPGGALPGTPVRG